MKLFLTTVLFVFLNDVCLPNQVAQSENKKITPTEKNYKQTAKLMAKADELLASYNVTDAIPIYQEILESEPNNANVHFKTGLCYLYSDNNPSKAIDHLKQAINDLTFDYTYLDTKQNKAPVDALYFLGKAYMANHLPDSAIKYIDLFSQENIKKLDRFNYVPTSEVFANMQRCNIANVAKYCRFNIHRELPEEGINSEFSESNPIVFDNGRQLFFASDRLPGNLPGRLHTFYTKLENQQWTDPKPFEHTTEFEEIPVFINKAEDELYLSIESGKREHNLFVSHRIDNKWSKPQKLKGKINSKGNETGLTISKDNSTMVIASERKGGFGRNDLYILKIKENGTWDKPVNLKTINSKYDEINPYFSENSDTIYFVSNRESSKKGLGGYDIYFVPFTNGVVGEPECLKYPINTVSHEKNIWISDREAFISSINKENNSDIFVIRNFTNSVVLKEMDAPNNIEPVNEYEASLSRKATGYKGGGASRDQMINEVLVLEKLGYVNVDDIDNLDKIIATEIIEKEVEVEVEKVVEKEKEVEVQVEVERVIETEKEVERFVDVNHIVEVEKIVEVIKKGDTKIEYVYLEKLNPENKEIIIKEFIKNIEVEKEPSFETLLTSLEMLKLDALTQEQRMLITNKLQKYFTATNLAEKKAPVAEQKPAKKSEIQEPTLQSMLAYLKGLPTENVTNEQVQVIVDKFLNTLSTKYQTPNNQGMGPYHGQLVDVVEFEYNSYFLPYSKVRQIKQLSKKLVKLNEYSIEIIGHCDSLGDFATNKDISIRRARSVFNQLKANNIPAEKIIGYGTGSYKPHAENNTPEGRSQNRRVEIYLYTREQTDELFSK